MPYQIDTGAVVAHNVDYEVVVHGEYEPAELVPCRRRVETNGPTCAFLAASVLGIEIEEPKQ
jgi:hypothetical protein